MTDQTNAPETAPAPNPTTAPTTDTTSTAAPVEPSTTAASPPPASTGAASASTPSTSGSVTTEAHEKRKGAVAYLENALTHALKELGKEGVIAVHGIESEYKAMKSFLDYQFEALKGKLGLK